MIGDELELPIQIIPHGIFYREGAHSAVQSKKSNLTIGFAGTIIEHKGVSNLIEAFMKVPGRKLQLQIYGSGNLDYVESLKKQAALDGRIHFMGQFKPEDAARIYTSLDLLVIPSTCYESYSMVKHEAIANGTPVAVSNIGALPEKIIHGENGFIFDPFQPETLSKIFQMLKASPEKLQHIQNGMRKLSVDAIEQEAFHYLRIYWDMVKK